MQYVIPGYAFTFVVLAAYSFQLIKRGQRLSEQLPEEDRRFLD